MGCLIIIVIAALAAFALMCPWLWLAYLVIAALAVIYVLLARI